MDKSLYHRLLLGAVCAVILGFRSVEAVNCYDGCTVADLTSSDLSACTSATGCTYCKHVEEKNRGTVTHELTCVSDGSTMCETSRSNLMGIKVNTECCNDYTNCNGGIIPVTAAPSLACYACTNKKVWGIWGSNDDCAIEKDCDYCKKVSEGVVYVYTHTRTCARDGQQPCASSDSSTLGTGTITDCCYDGNLCNDSSGLYALPLLAAIGVVMAMM